MSEFIIKGRISEKQSPCLLHFLQPYDLRASDARAILCRLIERAVALTDADKLRYDAGAISVLRRIAVPDKPRRLLVVVKRNEHPSTFLALEKFDFNNHQVGFIHLLEVAAGLLTLDGMALSNSLSAPYHPPHPARPHSEPEALFEQSKAAPAPVTTAPAKESRDIIASSSQNEVRSDIPAEDLTAIFGG